MNIYCALSSVLQTVLLDIGCGVHAVIVVKRILGRQRVHR